MADGWLFPRLVEPVIALTDDSWVASLKLETMGIKIDKLTATQKKYLSSWEMGT